MTQRELIDLAHSDDKTWHKVVVVAFLSNAKIWGKFFDESVPARFPPPPPPIGDSLCTPIPLLQPESARSGSASCDHCGRAFRDELRGSLFP